MKLISFFSVWHFSCLKLFGYLNTVLMDIVQYIIICRKGFFTSQTKKCIRNITHPGCALVNVCLQIVTIYLRASILAHKNTAGNFCIPHSAQLTSAHSLSSGPLSISSFDSSAHISSLFFVGQVFIYTQLPLIYPHTRRHPR